MIGVDMEIAAVFAVGQSLDIEVAALLLVSDEVAVSEWRAGFDIENFLAAQRRACQIAVNATAGLT